MNREQLQVSERKQDLRLAKVLFAAVGVGYLFPFSALTQPVDYWHKLFPDFNIEFSLTTVYMWINLLFLGLLVFVGREPSYNHRIVGGFTGQLLVLLLVPSSYFLGLGESMNFIIIMAATSIAAMVTALVDSCAISFAAQYPIEIQEALQFGIGLSTLIGSIYRLVTKAAFPTEKVVASSLLYFYGGAATVAFCILAYFYLLSLPISKQCLKFGINHKVYEKDKAVSSSATIEASMGFTNYRPRIENTDTNGESLLQNEGENLYLLDRSEVSRYHGKANSYTNELMQVSGNETLILNKFEVFKKVIVNELSVFLVFYVSLSLWPPLVTEIPSYNFPELESSGWWPLILLNLFSFSDCVGRLLTPYRGMLTKSNIWIVVVARFIFVPLLICSALGYYFQHDIFSIIFTCGLGLTNGYVGTLSVVMVNECVSQNEKGLAGTYTGFFLNLGLVFGATTALGIDQALLSSR